MPIDLVAAQAFNGLVLGMIYVLLAMGLSIVWGMMDIINFAHGLFYALGAYLAYTVVSVTGNFWLCLILVPLIMAGIGMLLEYVLLRRLYNENILYQILMTYGLAIAGRELIILIYNPVGKILNNIATPDFVPYISRVRNLDAKLRLITIQYRLHQRHIAKLAIPAWLAKLPVGLRDPYSGKPPAWDTQHSVLSFPVLNTKTGPDRDPLSTTLKVDL